MTKKELIKSISESVGFTQKDVATVIDKAFETISNTLATEEVSITGFGKFEAVDKPAKDMRNPSNGSIVHVPAKKAPKFRAGKALKEAVNA